MTHSTVKKGFSTIPMILKVQGAFFALVFGVVFTHGAAAAAIKVGTLDMAKTVDSTTRGKEAAEKLQEIAKQKQSKLLAERQSIAQAQENLIKGAGANLKSQEAKQKEAADIQRRMEELGMRMQEAEKELAAERAKLYDPIVADLRGVVSDISKKKNLDLVLEVQGGGLGGMTPPLVYAQDQTDLTDETIKDFEKKFPGTKKK